MATKIRIAARLRPSIPGEIIDDAVGIENDENGSFVTMSHPRDHTQRFKFPFSSCYGPTSAQEKIYENDVKPLLDIVFGGVVSIGIIFICVHATTDRFFCRFVYLR